MRKALMAVLMAATIATPVAAQDGQNRSRREGFVRSVQGATQNRAPRQENRAERPQRQEQRVQRQEQRVQRQEQRIDRREARPQVNRETGFDRPERVRVQSPAAT